MSGQLKVFIDRLVPIYIKINADIYLIATQYDHNKEIMNIHLKQLEDVLETASRVVLKKEPFMVWGLEIRKKCYIILVI